MPRSLTTAHPRKQPARRPRAAFATLLQEAIASHQAGDLDGAERLYGEVLRLQVAQPDALHFLGVLHHQRGRSEAGVELIRSALKITPRHPDAHNNLGNIHKECGRLREAE
ncbi:TPR repeat-containing protein, partial [mine drainage metagenome]